MIQGISHITFIVRDLEKMTKFLTSIFDAEEVYSSGEQTFSISKEKFFLINGLWVAIMEGEPLPEDLSENSQKLAVTSFDRCVSSCYPS